MFVLDSDLDLGETVEGNISFTDSEVHELDPDCFERFDAEREIDVLLALPFQVAPDDDIFLEGHLFPNS